MKASDDSRVLTLAVDGVAIHRNEDTEYRSLVANARAVAERLVESHQGIQRKWSHNDGRSSHLVNVHHSIPAFSALLHSEPVAAVVRDAFGDNPVYVTHSKISYKYAGSPQVWLPHQDIAYKNRGTDPASHLSVAIMLESCDEDNGAIRVLSGSWRSGRLRHRVVFAEDEIEPQLMMVDRLDGYPEIVIRGDAGDIAAFDQRTVHYSGPNRRRGVRPIFIFEVTKWEQDAMEFGGCVPVVLNASRGYAPPTLPRPGATSWLEWLREHVVVVLAKRVLYLTSQIFGIPPRLRAQPGDQAINRVAREREEWNDHFATSAGANAEFFAMATELRGNLFPSPPREGLTLELGAGDGNFAAMHGVAVVVDVSERAVRSAIRRGGIFGVVADATQLPFADETFAAVYAIDVLHHVKSTAPLSKSCSEVRRVLRPSGLFLVSDRLPGFYNSAILAISRIGRRIAVPIMRFAGRSIRLSGSDNEPPMTKADWAVIYEGMHSLREERWRAWPTPWIYMLQQIANLTLPPPVAARVAKRLVEVCRRIEERIGPAGKIEICVSLIRSGAGPKRD